MRVRRLIGIVKSLFVETFLVQRSFVNIIRRKKKKRGIGESVLRCKEAESFSGGFVVTDNETKLRCSEANVTNEEFRSWISIAPKALHSERAYSPGRSGSSCHLPLV